MRLSLSNMGDADRNEKGQFYKGMVGAHRSHGMTKTHLYRKFVNLTDRCTRTTNVKYPRYGGRGIKCLWSNFEHFYAEMNEGYLAHVAVHGEKNTTIDRIDVNGNYCKENCRWATWKTQQNNRGNNTRLTFNGRTMTLMQWSEDVGITYGTIIKRIRKGWPMEDVLSSARWVRHA